MRPVRPVIRFCLLICAIGTTGKLLAQAPVFNFDGANSPADLFASVWADDLADWPWDWDAQTSSGCHSPFPFSG